MNSIKMLLCFSLLIQASYALGPGLEIGNSSSTLLTSAYSAAVLEEVSGSHIGATEGTNATPSPFPSMLSLTVVESQDNIQAVSEGVEENVSLSYFNTHPLAASSSFVNAEGASAPTLPTITGVESGELESQVLSN